MIASEAQVTGLHEWFRGRLYFLSALCSTRKTTRLLNLTLLRGYNVSSQTNSLGHRFDPVSWLCATFFFVILLTVESVYLDDLLLDVSLNLAQQITTES